MKDLDRYSYRHTWSEEDEEHIGLCAEFPSLSWFDFGPEKALIGIRNLVQATHRYLAKSGEKPPPPYSLNRPQYARHPSVIQNDYERGDYEQKEIPRRI